MSFAHRLTVRIAHNKFIIQAVNESEKRVFTGILFTVSASSSRHDRCPYLSTKHTNALRQAHPNNR
ncbi:MAG: hypothetical protein MSG64_14475 [Pyrinomonadaceae bacterium MAG19_C2-C3]|nr:hypothetical protein [Pyrinomonadaceae bacterium MAG19_C2-C3]